MWSKIKIVLFFSLIAVAISMFLPENIFIFLLVGLGYCGSSLFYLTLGKELNKKESVFWVLLIIANLVVLIYSGAFFSTYGRFIVNCVIIFLSSILIHRIASKPKSLNPILFMVNGSTLLICYTMFGMKFGDPKFYPIALSPLIALVFFLGVSSLTKALITRIIVGVIFFAFLGNIGYPQYLNFILGKKTIVSGDKFRNNLFIDHIGNTLTIDSLKFKIVILDFWYSKCGPCFKEFPKFQKLYETYKEDPDVLIASINIPFPDDKNGDAFNLISQYKFYKFQNIKPLEYAELEWGVSEYPTTLIFDSLKNVRYKGLLNYGSGINSVHKIIQSLKGANSIGVSPTSGSYMCDILKD